jgi:putative DNA primase/helicase
MQQVWAQVMTLVEAGETWQLLPDEKEHIRRINEEHMQIDPIEEMILDKYRWDEIGFINEYKTATQIGADIGLKNITVRETRIISGHVCKYNGNKRERSHGKNLLLIPALKTVY